MLGKQIGEEAGQVAGTRVLPDEGAGPKVVSVMYAGGSKLWRKTPLQMKHARRQ